MLNDTRVCRNRPRTSTNPVRNGFGRRGICVDGGKRHERHSRARDSATDSELSIDCHKKSRSRGDKELWVIFPVNDRFRKVSDYRRYRLADKSSLYDDEVARSVSRWAKRLQVQMKSQFFDSLDPISIISFLSGLKLACGTEKVHQRAAL